MNRFDHELPTRSGAVEGECAKAAPVPAKRRIYSRQPEACVAGRRGCCSLCRPHPGRTAAHVARDDAVVDARRAGLSLRKIAAAHAITHQRVQQILREAGVMPVRRTTTEH